MVVFSNLTDEVFLDVNTKVRFMKKIFPHKQHQKQQVVIKERLWRYLNFLIRCTAI